MLTLRAAATALALLAASAAPAPAGSVQRIGDALVFDAAPGDADSVVLLQDAAEDPEDYYFVTGDTPATADGCEPYEDDRREGARCPAEGIARLVVNLGDGDDYAAGFESAFFSFCWWSPCPPPPPHLHPLAAPLTLAGGPGDDMLRDGAGDDALQGGEGDDDLAAAAGADALAGGGGRDRLAGGAGADALNGGPGIDEASYRSYAQRVAVTLDDRPGDGRTDIDEQDNVGSDVEDVAGGSGDDTLTGSAAANTLAGGAGDDHLDGGDGFDTYYGEEDGATVLARDGRPERVDCGDGGGDFASVDEIDSVAGCENLSRSAELQRDLDGDGFASPADCADSDSSIHPGAADRPDNGIDEDCSGADATIRDRDGDGFDPPADCDDAARAIHPGAGEVFGNPVDEDCSGRADPLQTLTAFVQSSFTAGRRSTLIRRLRVRNVEAGTLLRLRCRGGRRRGCRRASRDVLVARAARAVDVRRALRLGRLRPRAVVEIAILRADSVGEVEQMRVRSRRLPSISEHCLRPFDGRRIRCP